MSAAPLAMAWHYLGIEQPQKALDALEGVEERALEEAEYWVIRASALAELERHADASAAASRGLEAAPQDVDLLRLCAQSLGELGRVAEAERAILKALHLSSEDPGLLCTYARLLTRAGQIEKAGALVERAAQLAPDDARVTSTRLILAHVKGEEADAISHARSLLADAPDDPNRHYLMGFALAARGRMGAAGNHYRAAAEIDPGVEHVAEAARESRVASHPLLMPLRVLHRLGPAGVWLIAMVTLMVLAVAGARRSLLTFAIVYVLFCVYSWVAAPALRWWSRRRL